MPPPKPEPIDRFAYSQDDYDQEAAIKKQRLTLASERTLRRMVRGEVARLFNAEMRTPPDELLGVENPDESEVAGKLGCALRYRRSEEDRMVMKLDLGRAVDELRKVYPEVVILGVLGIRNREDVAQELGIRKSKAVSFILEASRDFIALLGDDYFDELRD